MYVSSRILYRAKTNSAQYEIISYAIHERTGLEDALDKQVTKLESFGPGPKSRSTQNYFFESIQCQSSSFFK